MIKNKILNEYLDKQCDKDEIYNNIYHSIKIKSKKKTLNILSTLFVIIIIGISGGIIYAKRNWDKEYSKYLNRNIETSKSSANWDLINDNTENLEMDYIYQDGIGVKIDSLLITDYTCQIDINFKLSDNYIKLIKHLNLDLQYMMNKIIYIMYQKDLN